MQVAAFFVPGTSECVRTSSEHGGRKITMLTCTAGKMARHTGKEEVLTSAWVEAWSIAATDKDVLGSMSSNASSMFSYMGTEGSLVLHD